MSINEKYLKLGWFVFLISAFGIILGGAYQIQCAYLGFLSRYENKGAFYEFLKFLKLQAKIVFGIGFSKYSNCIADFIWIYGISKLASFIYTYIPPYFYFNNRETSYDYSRRLV